MTDREMLLLAYGAIKATGHTNHNLDNIVILLEEHLWPPTVSHDLDKDEEVYRRAQSGPINGG